MPTLALASKTLPDALPVNLPDEATCWQAVQRRDRGYYPPPPPPRRRHHDNTGAAIAGGLAAGVIGGMIGGAIVNNSGPRYVEPPPPPPPRCWFEDRRVPNAYDGGWHMESMRVCR